MDLDSPPVLKSKSFRFHQHLTTTDTHKYISIPTPSQDLKFKISFHEVLGQGLNWEIVSAFEINHVLDLAVALFLFVYQVRIFKATAVWGAWGLSSCCFIPQERCRVHRVKG